MEVQRQTSVFASCEDLPRALMFKDALLKENVNVVDMKLTPVYQFDDGWQLSLDDISGRFLFSATAVVQWKSNN